MCGGRAGPGRDPACAWVGKRSPPLREPSRSACLSPRPPCSTTPTWSTCPRSRWTCGSTSCCWGNSRGGCTGEGVWVETCSVALGQGSCGGSCTCGWRGGLAGGCCEAGWAQLSPAGPFAAPLAPLPWLFPASHHQVTCLPQRPPFCPPSPCTPRRFSCPVQIGNSYRVAYVKARGHVCFDHDYYVTKAPDLRILPSAHDLFIHYAGFGQFENRLIRCAGAGA